MRKGFFATKLLEMTALICLKTLRVNPCPPGPLGQKNVRRGRATDPLFHQQGIRKRYNDPKKIATRKPGGQQPPMTTNRQSFAPARSRPGLRAGYQVDLKPTLFVIPEKNRPQRPEFYLIILA